MKLLLLSFYYPPDLSAGSFRIAALVKALLKVNTEIELVVVTTQPNRYRSYSQEAPETETGDRLVIHRVTLPDHRSGMLDQARAFLAFAIGARRLVRELRPDLVYATSSRLMTAALGSHLARIVRAPLYLDVRDLFVDTIEDVVPWVRPFKPALTTIERHTLSRAASINVVSPGFVDYVAKRFPKARITCFTNGIDDDFTDLPRGEPAAPGCPILVLYAGNIGEGQGLHLILPDLARRTAGKARFRIIGDGGRAAELIDRLANDGVSNVEVVTPMSRRELIGEYGKADVLFLHLNAHKALRKVLPSKLFEYSATGKPILAGLDGYAAEFTAERIANAAIFHPCDADDAASALSRLTLAPTDRAAFIVEFSRSEIMKRMAADIIDIAQSRRSER